MYPRSRQGGDQHQDWQHCRNGVLDTGAFVTMLSSKMVGEAYLTGVTVIVRDAKGGSKEREPRLTLLLVGARDSTKLL